VKLAPFICLLLLPSVLLAQVAAPTKPASPPSPKTESTQLLLPDHKWVVPPPRHNPAAFFTNLHTGDAVVSPFVVQFGMALWGIAPAEHKHARTGHHHLLVDAPLPIPITASIPTSKNYVHFGKGQMQTVLDLMPGKHTLRLLLADHNHVPHMVFSEEITVNVTGRDTDKAEKLKKIEPELSFPNLKNGDQVHSTFKVQFHAAGLNIASKLTQLPETGYFQLKMSNYTGKVEHITLAGGQTEVWLKPPEGEYKIQLHYVKNPSGELHSVASKVLNIKVTGR
jgi:Domain of unknown function (DUF4399)